MNPFEEFDVPDPTVFVGVRLWPVFNQGSRGHPGEEVVVGYTLTAYQHSIYDLRQHQTEIASFHLFNDANAVAVVLRHRMRLLRRLLG